jgi:hypothetical protein
MVLFISAPDMNSEAGIKERNSRKLGRAMMVDMPVHRGGSMDKFNNLKPT